MTEKLRELLHHRANEIDFDPVDLDRVVRDGDRRVRRRRGLVGAAGLAAASVAGAAVFTWIGGGSESNQGPEVASPVVKADSPAYARGSVIHQGERTIDLGVPVRAFVRTSVGYVAVAPSGTVFSVVGGSVSEVGRMDAGRIRVVSDPDGSLAGWVQSEDDRPTFVVLDQADGTVTRNNEATTAGQGLLADEADPAYFYAVDDGTAYWRDTRGAVAVDVANGETRVVKADARNGFDLIDAESGQVAFQRNGTVEIGTTATDIETRLKLAQSGGGTGQFSPDGRYLSLDADSPEVFDLTTGRTVDFTGVPDFFATGYEWLDADTLVMISLESEKSPVDLLTCSVSNGTCEVALDDLGSIDDYEKGRVTIPVGEALSD